MVSNTEYRVNVYLVPGVRDETMWITGPSPSGALMFVSMPSHWRTKLVLLLILFHCRVMLLLYCPDFLNPSTFWGADIEKWDVQRCSHKWFTLVACTSVSHWSKTQKLKAFYAEKQWLSSFWNILPVTAVSCTPLLLMPSNTEIRVNVYLVPAVRDETVWITGIFPSGALMFVSMPSYWRTKLMLLILFHCRVMLDSFCPEFVNPPAFWGADIERDVQKL